MAYNVTEVFKASLDAKGVKYDVVNEEGNAISIGYKLENTKIRIYVLFDDEETVQIRGGAFLEIPENKLESMYKVVNACNSHFRWVKFSVNNEQHDVNSTIDAVIDLETCAEEVFQLVQRTCAIVDQAYPIFMKGLWG